uniref:Uncharacterized protein n=1 Tax=Fagus sylvatica TaxID=28930 RepID=A0A2N9G5R2_FAGSY
MKEVLEALRDDNINMISICGMGGIGKTTMAKEVAKRAKEAKLFDEDVMAVVSQNQDVKHIQGQIADMLHLATKNREFTRKSKSVISRLMGSKSVLVILDDVWEALNLTDVGIPCGGQNKRCKILLTSRSEEACNQMRSQKIVPIKVLSEEEAWNLFREMAGDCVDTPGLRPTARRDMELDEGLFAKIDNVAEARIRVHAMVKNLKRSFLLLDSSKEEECVKMHDVVRDVAISIAEEQWISKCPKLELLQAIMQQKLFTDAPSQSVSRDERTKGFVYARDISWPIPREVLQWCTACLFWQPNISSPRCMQPFEKRLFIVHSEGFGSTPRVIYRRCTDMEEIFSKEGQDEKAFDMIKFPQLKHVELYDVPRLIGFCTFVDPIELVQPSHAKGTQPILNQEEIKIIDCNKLKTFGSEIQSPRKQKKIKGLDSRPQEPGVGSSSVQGSPGFLGRCLECVPHRRNYGLVDLSDHMCPTKKSHGSSSVNKEGTLTKLKDQRASVIDKPLEIWSFFPSNMIECLKNLEVIELRGCHSIEAIFQLEELNVEENHVASVLNQLRDLKLNVLPKMMHIWKKGPERIMGFGNLRLLERKYKLLTAKKLKKSLQEQEKKKEKKKTLFRLRKLTSIVLDNLPNLECFCNEANAFGWPSLKKMRVESCPTLRTFVPAKLLTPQLEGVYEDDEYKTCQWKGDLNATIEHIFKGKGGG